MPNTLQALYLKRNLSDVAVQKIEEIRSSQPVRRVGSNGHNVRVRYASKKMGLVIQAESHTVELPAIVMMEHDPEVFEFYDQPTTLKLTYSHPSGRKRSHLHTPDFFIISESFIGFEEWKPLEKLEKLSSDNPFRYSCLDGTWTCPPGVDAAKSLGLEYRVRTNQDINPVLYKNILFLEDYFGEITIDESVRGRALTALQEKLELNLDELMHVTGKRSTDTLYRMIVTGELYVDLEKENISYARDIRVFRDRTTALAVRSNVHNCSKSQYPILGLKLVPGMTISWDGVPWKLLNVGLQEITFSNQDAQLVQIPHQTVQNLIHDKNIVLPPSPAADANTSSDSGFRNAHPKMLEQAQRRFESIRIFLDDNAENSTATKNNRTLRRWIKRYQEAEVLCGNGFTGLLPKEKNRGNRLRRLPEKTINIMHEVIATDHLTPKNKNKYSSYIKLDDRCKSESLDVPSYRTFCKAIKQYALYEKTKRREGKKAAYKYERVSGRSELRQHAVRPFEMAFIDHTKIDLEVVSETTGKPIGRPWLTIMIDEYSRRILAFYLSFDAPSYRACMVVIRECVKRYNRLPDNIIVDNGKEFESIYFEVLLSRCGVHKKNRPPAKPKFGSVCERMFGTINTSFLNNLLGNTQATKNVRELTRETNPKNLAVWTFPALHESIEAALYRYYDSLLHSLGSTPKDLFEAGIAKTGLREARYIPYDRDFFLLTLPSTRKGTARVQPGIGVKINYLYYWCEGLRNPELEYQQVSIKYDPTDISTAYVYIHGAWTECKSEYAFFYDNKNEQLLRTATAEIGRLRSLGNRRLQINATTIMKQIQEIEEKESQLIERVKSTKDKNSYESDESNLEINKEIDIDQMPVELNSNFRDLPILEDF